MRNCVMFYVPLEGFLGPLSWAPEHMRRMDGRKFMFADYTNRRGARPSEACCPSKSTGWVGGSPIALAAKAKIAPSLADVLQAVGGLSRASQRAALISGTHPSRHVGPEVVEPLNWPTADQDVLGDWASQPLPRSSSAGEAAASRAKQRAQVTAQVKRVRAGARAKRQPTRASYQRRASKGRQLAVRARWVLAVREFVRFRVAALSVGSDLPTGISWAELIPRQPPHDALRPFYGASADIPSE